MSVPENGDARGAGIETINEPEDGDAEAHELFRLAVRTRHTPVREIMTPRTDMVGAPHSASLDTIVRLSEESGFSRFPVYRGNRDQVIGILHVKDLLPLLGADRWSKTTAEDLVRPPAYVPETKPISELLREFRDSQTHIGIVLDEYGGTSGLVTLEDMVEAVSYTHLTLPTN